MNILSVVFEPYQLFISNFNLISLFVLISSLVTCREDEKVVFFVENVIRTSCHSFSTLISSLSAILFLLVVQSPAEKMKKLYFCEKMMKISYQYFRSLSVLYQPTYGQNPSAAKFGIVFLV